MASQETPVTPCPFCPERGSRQEVHLHLVDSHADRIDAWTDAQSGHMHYRVPCPVCGEAYEHRVKPRSHDPRFLGTFAREIRMVGFDMLLNHLQAEHAEGAEEQAEPASMPESGPGGGRGRPGVGGIPVPPGMEGADAQGVPGHPRTPGRQPPKGD